jgi:hypothetical protein
MHNRILLSSLFSLILTSVFYSHDLRNARATSFTDAKTLVLYDAASGDLPSTSLMAFTDFPSGTASPTYAEGATVLDTTVSGEETFAGWVTSPTTISGFPILDRMTGVQVNFTLEMESETHGNSHRAGFSVIILDQEAKGIEIAFWENQIWVQSDENTGGLFKHGEGIAYATTAGLTNYQVTIVEDTYTLTANSEQLLTGPLRDYRSFSGFPDPYEMPNFLFLGDDSTSSQARVRLSFVSITGTEPAVPTVTAKSTNTSTPLPTASSTPLPSATPAPSPSPSPIGFEFCPSIWLVGAVVIANATLMQTIRRRMKHC